MNDRIPPEELIVANGVGVADYAKITDDFIRIGTGITTNMRAAGLMTPRSRVLDVGCGLGRLARPLVPFLTDGEYHGLDIERSSIDWCTRAYADVPNFTFHFADVYSTTYNTSSGSTDDAYKFPFEDQKFDFVWSTSLFTHMKIAGTTNYLREMGRVIAPGGHCWNTYLLLDDYAEAACARMDGSTRWYLPHRIDGGRVRDLQDWASQAALDLDRVKIAHEEAGLEIVDVRFGPWSGRTENVRAGGQDVIIARKR